jgi:hypothetical protein
MRLMLLALLVPAATALADQGYTPRDPELRKAVALYTKFELPMPPPDAQLVLVNTGFSGVPEGSRVYEPAYLLPRTAKAPKGSLMFGTGIRDAGFYFYDPSVIRPINPVTESVRHNVKSFGLAGDGFRQDTVLANTTQNAALGNEAYALRLARNLRPRFYHYWTWQLGRPRDEGLEAGVAMLAMTHYANELLKPGTDRRAISAKLQEVVATGLVRDDDTHYGLAAFLKGLNESIEPVVTAHGSPEYYIEELKEEAGTGFATGRPAAKALIAMGERAIPALKSHLEDARLTRRFFAGIGLAPPAIKTIGQVAGGILQRIEEKRKGGQALAP